MKQVVSHRIIIGEKHDTRVSTNRNIEFSTKNSSAGTNDVNRYNRILIFFAQ